MAYPPTTSEEIARANAWNNLSGRIPVAASRPEPAITDEMVERAVQALSRFDLSDLDDAAMRDVARSTILAALHPAQACA